MLSIAERHKYILDSLNKHGFVRITDVANELGVTKVTIRKDIKILESKGLLYKVHGSARPANPHVADLDVHVKDNINRDAKRRIAQRAAEMARRDRLDHRGLRLDRLRLRRGDQDAHVASPEHRHAVPAAGRAAERVGERQRRAAGRLGAQEVAVGAGRRGRARTGRLHLARRSSSGWTASTPSTASRLRLSTRRNSRGG